MKIKKITINMSEKEMDAIEDAFFTDFEGDTEKYDKIRPLIVRVWTKLCKGMDDGNWYMWILWSRKRSNAICQ